MPVKVFVNGRSIAGKAAAGKSTAAFPDVCLSPPGPPAGPVPIPYPNTAMAKETAGGSTKVKVNGQPVMLKDKSYFKKSTGDEAATKSFPMGVMTGTIQGKAYFASWSMNVKMEGLNAVRHMDMTTHNHIAMSTNTPPQIYMDTTSEAEDEDVETDEISVLLLDDADEPVPGASYKMKLPDGTETGGMTNDKGIAYVFGIDPGNCEVCFPDLDEKQVKQI